MSDSFFSEFKNPGHEWRGAPFWAWNGKLEENELRRQIRVMKRMGLGGFFMHARVGLNTAYLSDEWFDCVKACVDEAKKQGMNAWLYDEDRWPSGAAGGLVTKNPEYRMRRLTLDEIANASELKWDDSVLAAFTADIDGATATNVRRLERGATPELTSPKARILRFGVKTLGTSSWYNNQSYLDTLSDDAVQEFIRVTHEAYKREVSDDFGGAIPGSFTDEPSYQNICMEPLESSHQDAPWTGKLVDVFQERYGYDIVARLPEVFYDVDGKSVSQARYHYLECLTYLFSHSFARQIGEWHEKNGLFFTGHIMVEETLSSQARMIGSAMRVYEFMNAPGIDMLTERWRAYETAKQCASVARQFGRQWRLTETYGCTGWEFPFAGHKATSDWQAALGINLRCQHLSWYTMEGEAKRDYPASIFYQSPWFESYAKVEDYFARVNLTITQGEEVRDALVIHPVESAWCLVKKGWNPSDATFAFDQTLVKLRDSLLGENLDFDYGDEDILARHAKVDATGDAPMFQVGQAAYKAVVVPPMITIRQSTLDLLKAFKDAGGAVIFAGPAAEYVDALASTAATDLASQCVNAPAEGKDLAKAVEPYARRVSITDANGQEIAPVLYNLHEDDQYSYLFICNTSVEQDSSVNVCSGFPKSGERRLAFPDARVTGFADHQGAPLELNADTGEMFQANASRDADGWKIETSFAALESRVFLFPKQANGEKYPTKPNLSLVSETSLGDKNWAVTLSEANVAVLDQPRYRIDDGEWRDGAEIMSIDDEVRDALGVQRRGGRMCQPWALEKPVNPRRVKVELIYQFQVEDVPNGHIQLALEQPKTFEIYLNGQEISPDNDEGWWRDRSLRTLPISCSLLSKGVQELRLICDYDECHPGLEIMYLLGDFGVKADDKRPTLIAPVTTLDIGDWVNQGLPYYAGSVRYRQMIAPTRQANERVFVEVPAYQGTAVKIWVNNQPAGVIAWEPNQLDITDYLQDGANELGVELLGNCRNSHGPYYYKDLTPPWVGPGQYHPGDDMRSDVKNLVAIGLTDAPKLVVKA